MLISSYLSLNPNQSFSEETAVGTVGDMIQQGTKAHDISQINVDVVPDFSKLMNTMKNQGAI